MGQIKNKITGQVVSTPYIVNMWGIDGYVDIEDGIIKFYIGRVVNQSGDTITPDTFESLDRMFTTDLDYAGIEHEEDEDVVIVPVEGDNHYIGYYEASPSNLMPVTIYYMAGNWFAVRNYNSGEELAACGANIINSPNFRDLNIPSGIVISGGITDHGGLSQPESFPVQNFLNLFTDYEQLSNRGSFTKKDASGGGGVPTSSLIWGCSSWDGYKAWSGTNEWELQLKLAAGFSNQDSPDTNYRNLRPFHAYDVTGTYKTVRYWYYNPSTLAWEQRADSRYIDMNFNGDNQEVADQMIGYVKEAGFSYISFLYYASDADLAYGRQRFVLSNNKQGVNLAYNTHGIAGAANINGESVNQGYLDSIIEITNHMREVWYQKIDGKPLVFVDVPSTGNLKNDLDRAIKCKQDIQSYYGGSNNIYFVLSRVYPILDFNESVPDTATNVWGYVSSHFDKINWYSGSGDTSRTYASIAADDIATTNNYISSPVTKVIPCLTTSLYVQPMRTHPLDKPVDLSQIGQYYVRATSTELRNHIQNMINTYSGHSKVDTICVYSLTEYYENGRVIGPVKLSDGTINKDVVNDFKSKLLG